MSSKLNYFLGTIGALTVGYAVYFDYQRRNSPDFRKKLRKNEKQHEKLEHEKVQEEKSVKLDTVKDLLLQSLKEDPLPTDNAQKEDYFMTQVTLGEQLASIPGNELKSALSFYRALSVYPNPTDILSIYQRSIPETVYEYIIMMIAIQPPMTVASILSESGTTIPLVETEQD